MIVCRGCGRTIESEFIYCPWCGFSKVQAEEPPERLDAMFDKLGRMQDDSRARRINDMERKLDALESELSVLAPAHGAETRG